VSPCLPEVTHADLSKVTWPECWKSSVQVNLSSFARRQMVCEKKAYYPTLLTGHSAMKCFHVFNINLLAIMGIASYYKGLAQCLSQGGSYLNCSM